MFPAYLHDKLRGVRQGLQLGKDLLGCGALTPQAEDAWLCSASLRLLSGEASEALAAKLGWQDPLSVSTLGTQLVELGKVHPEVRRPFTAQVQSRYCDLWSHLKQGL